MGFLGRGAGRLLSLLLLAGLGVLGWVWAPRILPELREWAGLMPQPVSTGAAPTPELADSVLERVQRFRQDGEGQMALGGRELTAVLRHALPGLIPSGVRELGVGLEGGQVRLSAEVVLAAFPDLPDLGPILGFLPDTVDVVLLGSLLPFGEEESALLVQGLEVSRIPIPQRLIPGILRGIGRADRPGLPPEALPVPLPAGLGSVYILSDSLILSFAP